jgi:hypothetical protein
MPLNLARHADQLLASDGFFERRCDDAEYFADPAGNTFVAAVKRGRI